MAGFNDVITRSDVPIPTEEVGELLKVMPEESILLKRARRQPMSTKSLKQTIMTTFPDAYWVDGDTGLKQTTKQELSPPERRRVAANQDVEYFHGIISA